MSTDFMTLNDRKNGAWALWDDDERGDGYDPAPVTSYQEPMSVAPTDAIQAAVAVGSQLTTKFQPGMAFELNSSVVYSTPEVKEMREAHDNKRPLAIYEILQGMVDYGAGKTPPPRMRICYLDGSKTDFDGTEAAFARADIVAIEFFNAGPGLKPEELTIIRHNSDRDDTLGQHGRGTTVALTYLNCEGLKVGVTSNCYGYEWQADTHLEPTTTGLDHALAVTGTIAQPVTPGQEHTLFRVEAGTNLPRFATFCREALKATDLFLYANPSFPDASLVEAKVDGAAMRAAMLQKGTLAKVGTGEVMCLVGIADNEEGAQKGYNFVYVDGIKLPLRYYEKPFLPWSIIGLGNAPYPYKVRRGNDSTTLHAYDLSKVISEAVCNLQDKEILRKLIKASVGSSSTYLEFGRNDHLSINANTKALVAAIWQEEYGESLVNDLTGREDRYLKKSAQSGSFKKVKTVHKNLYEFLNSCGVPTLVKEIAEQDCTKIQSYERFKVPFIKSGNVIHELITYLIKQSAGELRVAGDLLELDGQHYLGLSFAQEQGQDLGNDFSSSGRCVKVAGVVAAKTECQIRILITAKDQLSELDVQPNEDYEGIFTAAIEVATYGPEKRSQYSNLQDDQIYILIPDNTPIEAEGDGLMAHAKKLWSDLQERLQKSKDLAALLSRRHDVFARARLAREIAGRRMGKVTRMGVAKVGRRDTTFVSADLASRFGDILMGFGQKPMERPHDDFLSDGDAVMTPGFYARSVASRFGHDATTSSIYCEGESDLVPVHVPHKSTMRVADGGCRHTITNLKGDCLLPVKSGHQLAAYTLPEGGDVQFYRDLRTGMFAVVGEAPLLTYSTVAEHQGEKLFYQVQPPLAEEREDVVSTRHLDGDWQSFLSKFKKKSLTRAETERRVAAARDKWSQEYTYDSADDLDEQVYGSSLQEVMSKILNTRRGICNLSASGFAVLLRAMGIPTRLVGGYMVNAWGGGGTHAIVEYWNTEEWVAIDPGDFIGDAGNAQVSYYQGTIRREPVLQERRPTPISSRLRMAILAALAGTLLAGASFQTCSNTEASPSLQDDAGLTTPTPGVTPPEGPKPPRPGTRDGDSGVIKPMECDCSACTLVK